MKKLARGIHFLLILILVGVTVAFATLKDELILQARIDLKNCLNDSTTAWAALYCGLDYATMMAAIEYYL